MPACLRQCVPDCLRTVSVIVVFAVALLSEALMRGRAPVRPTLYVRLKRLECLPDFRLSSTR